MSAAPDLQFRFTVDGAAALESALSSVTAKLDTLGATQQRAAGAGNALTTTGQQAASAIETLTGSVGGAVVPLRAKAEALARVGGAMGFASRAASSLSPQISALIEPLQSAAVGAASLGASFGPWGMALGAVLVVLPQVVQAVRNLSDAQSEATPIARNYLATLSEISAQMRTQREASQREWDVRTGGGTADDVSARAEQLRRQVEAARAQLEQVQTTNDRSAIDAAQRRVGELERLEERARAAADVVRATSESGGNVVALPVTEITGGGGRRGGGAATERATTDAAAERLVIKAGLLKMAADELALQQRLLAAEKEAADIERAETEADIERAKRSNEATELKIALEEKRARMRQDAAARAQISERVEIDLKRMAMAVTSGGIATIAQLATAERGRLKETAGRIGKENALMAAQRTAEGIAAIWLDTAAAPALFIAAAQHAAVAAMAGVTSAAASGGGGGGAGRGAAPKAEGAGSGSSDKSPVVINFNAPVNEAELGLMYSRADQAARRRFGREV